MAYARGGGRVAGAQAAYHAACGHVGRAVRRGAGYDLTPFQAQLVLVGTGVAVVAMVVVGAAGA